MTPISEPLFRIDEVAERPQCLVGEPRHFIVDQFDWLQLTIGRFLAPSVRSNDSVQYLLYGYEPTEPANRDPQEIARTIEREVRALRTITKEIRTSLNARVPNDNLLLSLQVLGNLRVPEPDSDRFRICDDMLVISHWGLEQGCRLLDWSKEDFEALERTLRKRYRVQYCLPLDREPSTYESNSELMEELRHDFRPADLPSSERARPEPAAKPRVSSDDRRDRTDRRRPRQRRTLLRRAADVAPYLVIGVLAFVALRPERIAAVHPLESEESAWALQFLDRGEEYRPVMLVPIRPEGRFDVADMQFYYAAAPKEPDEYTCSLFHLLVGREHEYADLAPIRASLCTALDIHDRPQHADK